MRLSNGVASIDNNHMLLERYISQFNAGKIVLFQALLREDVDRIRY
jgi:hypothetical protein